MKKIIFSVALLNISLIFSAPTKPEALEKTKVLAVENEEKNIAYEIVELEKVIESMPNTQLKRVLNDAFWYIDLVTVEQQKEFMLKRINFYN